MAVLNQSAPQVVYYRELESLFYNDPHVMVLYDDKEEEVKLYVDGQVKADAISKYLPGSKKWGNITLKITVIPSNSSNESPKEGIEAVFYENKALSYIKEIKNVFANDITYVVFRNEVVQYFSDNLGDIHGLKSTLYQDIASNVLENCDGIFFCTDVPNSNPYSKPSFGRPLGEWP